MFVETGDLEKENRILTTAISYIQIQIEWTSPSLVQEIMTII